MARLHRARRSRNPFDLPLFRWAKARQPIKCRTYAESRLAERCRLSSPHLVAAVAELAGFPREGGNDS